MDERASEKREKKARKQESKRKNTKKKCKPAINLKLKTKNIAILRNALLLIFSHSFFFFQEHSKIAVRCGIYEQTSKPFQVAAYLVTEPQMAVVVNYSQAQLAASFTRSCFI